MQFETIETSTTNLFLEDFKNLGFSYCSLGLCTEKNLLGIFSHVDWQRRYQSLRLFEFDPLFQTAIQQQGIPIVWSAVPKPTQNSALIMKVRNEVTETESGITLGFKKDEIVSILALGAKVDNLQFFGAFNHYLSLIQTKVLSLQCHIFRFP